MKRIVLLLVAMMVYCANSFAQDFTPEQKKLRSNILQFLKEEGYMPEVYTDGDIVFKKEGAKYYISIDKRDVSPLYLSISLSYLYDDTFSERKVSGSLKELNLNKAVKVLCYEKSYSYHAEMYLVNVEHFKYTFYKLMSQLDSLKSELGEICGSSSNSSSNRRSTTTIQQFFPIYGITLGKTTVMDMKQLGFVVEQAKGATKSTCNVQTLEFWDHDRDNIFESIYMTDLDYIPNDWEQKFKFSWALSYSEWMSLFEGLNFTVIVNKKPTVKFYRGRKTLSAEFTAISADNSLEFKLDFNNGNGKKEGSTLDSKNSLYSISVRSIKVIL